MLRMTLDQLRELKRQQQGEKPGKARAKRRGPTPEAIVTEQCIDWLRAKGWACTRRQVGLFVSYADAKRGVLRPIHVGEKGESDWHCERSFTKVGAFGLREAFSLELKAPGKQPTPEQQDWMRRRNACGFLALWADSLEALVAAYGRYFS